MVQKEALPADDNRVQDILIPAIQDAGLLAVLLKHSEWANIKSSFTKVGTVTTGAWEESNLFRNTNSRLRNRRS